MISELFNNKQFIISINTKDNKYILKKLVEDTEDKYDIVGEYITYDNAVDKMYKIKEEKPKKFPPIICYRVDSYNNRFIIKKIKISSATSELNWFKLWIIYDLNKSREKISYYSKTFIKDTEHNLQCNDKIIQLEKDIETLKNSIEYYTEQELKKHFEVN